MNFQEDSFLMQLRQPKNVVKVFLQCAGMSNSCKLMPHFEGFSASGFGLLQYVVCFASFPGSHVPKHEH